MNDSLKCPRCGGDLPANFPPGVCPVCLLQQGMSPSTFVSGFGSSGGSAGSRPQHRWTPPTPAELAPRFPQLEIVELLGQGGMGAVYKVRQRDLDRWAALKILPNDVAHDPNFAERFQREARALALLGHQHIVIVYEFGQREGVYFLLMEYVDGVNLRQAIRGGQILARDALGIVTQICDALQFAHEEGVVHRDIKPENILIDKRGRVKIADFGLAKLLGRTIEVATLTGTHQVMGTPVYMAPEQMEGTRGVDHRADIFSLGVVFYELLTGELPLGRFAPPSQKYSLDVRLDEVVLRTLEKEPDRRYQQASEVKGDVETIRSQPPTVPVLKVRKQRRVLRVLLATLAVIFLAICFVAVREMRTANDEAARYRQLLSSSNFPPRMVQSIPLPLQSSEKSIAPSAIATDSSSGANRDPVEANAIVQFTSETAKLHPNFGQEILSAEHRVLVNQVLTSIHKKYLELESRRTVLRVEHDGTQITFVHRGRIAGSEPDLTENASGDYDDDIARLENELWTRIDAQVPYEQQKFLRQYLPIFADDGQPPRVVHDASTPGMTSGGMGATPSIPSTAGSSMSSMMGAMGGNFYPNQRWSSNMRYEQLLGWNRDLLPIQITIRRRGKWFRWNIVSSHAGGVSREDGGEDPQLPSGLRRFWRADATPTPKPTSLQDSERPMISEEPPFDESRRARRSVFDPEGVDIPVTTSQISPNVGRIPEPDSEPIPRIGVNEATDAFDDDLSAVVPRARRTATSDEPTLVERSVRGIPIDAERARLPEPVDSFSEPDSEPIPRVGVAGSLDASRDLPVTFMPRDDEDTGSVNAQVKPLADYLREIDNLRAGEQTPWNEVELRTNSLLQLFPTPADKGRIHWQAAHVYAQSSIRNHAADVTRHSKESLKYERDPVQRAWMFMYLGNAAEVHDNNPGNFVEGRTEATRWYLKGYRELLPFHLPSEAPELPSVEKIGEEFAFDPDGDVDPEKTSAEVRHAAQMKIRQAAETTRDLVQKREAYIARLKDLFGPLHDVYDKNADAEVRFRAIATRVLPDAKEIDALVAKVFARKVVGVVN